MGRFNRLFGRRGSGGDGGDSSRSSEPEDDADLQDDYEDDDEWFEPDAAGDCGSCGQSLDGAEMTSPWEDGDNLYGYATCRYCGGKNMLTSMEG